MAALPLVLAGPIVRRVDTSGCSIWMALSEQRSVTLSIWQGSQTGATTAGTVASGAAALVSSEATALRRLGENLFAGVITAPFSGAAALAPGMFHAYDINVEGAGTLKQLGMLSDGVAEHATLAHLALGYNEDALPGFVAPSASNEELSLVHASCRKPHGPEFDAMAWLDDELAAHATGTEAPSGATRRPQQLFLTGDQIYADDVATTLLVMLHELGRDLIGTDRPEKLTIKATAGQLDADPDNTSQTQEERTLDLTLANFPQRRRKRLVRQTAGFSSTSARNHLLGFGEFSAMYLAAWSPAVWRPLTEPEDLFPSDTATIPHQKLLDKVSDSDVARAGVSREHENVRRYRDSVAKVARALANVSTYMIFDDHEITDDWNLTQQWRNRVYSNPLGKAIIRNGMMAFGIFQAWGNDPVQFAKSSGNHRKFLDRTQTVLGTSGNALSGELPAGNTDELDELIGSTEVANSKRTPWNYLVPGPRYTVCVLDTRTRRAFKGQGIGPPDLLGSSLNTQLPAASSAPGKDLLVLVSPVPVFGPHLIDKIAAPLYRLIGDFKFGKEAEEHQQAQRDGSEDESEDLPRADVGAEAADAESWEVNDIAREKLLARLAPYGRVVILSGDVHYACSLRLDYWNKTSSTSVPVVQLTSSATHNSFHATVESVLRYNARLQQYQEGFLPELLAWNKAKPLTIPAGSVLDPGKRARHARNPALLDSRHWPAGVSIPAANNPPDWRWRLRLLADERAEAALPIDAARLPPFEADDVDPLSPATLLARLRLVAARHQAVALQNRFHLLRHMVFRNNIGLVNFASSSGALQVSHTLLSHSATVANRGTANTVHQTDLAATGESAPTLVTSE